MKKKKKELKVVTIGKPSIEALSTAEQEVFYKTLLDRIIELKTEEDKKQEVEK